MSRRPASLRKVFVTYRRLAAELHLSEGFPSSVRWGSPDAIQYEKTRRAASTCGWSDASSEGPSIT